MSVHWASDPGMPVITWRKFSATGGFRVAFEHLLELMKERQCPVAMANFENMSVLDSDDQLWLREKWLPFAAAQGLRHLAVILPSISLGKLSLMKGLRFEDASRLEIAYFNQKIQCENWLKRISQIAAA
ncbi:MAG: hypothetical protein KDC45_12270 [Bacteroidetes bacterium]|nr:hypothetical protein [Bacteroidota bacterium]